MPWSVWYLPSKWIRAYDERAHDHVTPLQTSLCPGAQNDGLVSLDSSRWGKYKGTVPLDHLEQIGLGVLGNKHLPLYRHIVFQLAEIEAQEKREGKQGESKNTAQQQQQQQQQQQAKENTHTHNGRKDDKTTR